MAEITFSLKSGRKLYSFQDTMANLATGIGNQCINIGVAFLVFKTYNWLYEYSFWKIPSTWYSLIFLLLLQDFIFYWFHRLGHTINIFWAAHMPHHSSEEMNLSVGIRASFTQRLFQFVFFNWILVLVGYSPDAVYAIAAIHLLLAYWHHTKVIKSMGWFERYFVTPSHHRVHHGVNTQYLDKNFSEFLIIWDKMFGTFEPEKEEVCFGVTHPPRTWNPIFISFQYWHQLWQDMRKADRYWDKIRIWFMPLGWQPNEYSIETKGYSLKDQVKYVSTQFKNLNLYLIIQLIISIPFLLFTINMKLDISYLERAILSIGIFLMIISWGGLLESKKWSPILEIIRLLFMGFTLIITLSINQIAIWYDWPSITISILVGLSILYISTKIRKEQLKIPLTN
ncbi:MAG: sterol desaturase family protein [Reichenbachiella sp.]